MKRLAASIAAALVAGVTVGACGGSGPGGSYTVRALFDNAGFAVSGEQVRIAGAPVGTISGLSVTPNNLAAVSLAINNGAFTPWHANATCTIRPQSLIAERYVDCDPGTSSFPALPRINRGPGAGSYLLPVNRTSSPIDPDIVQGISQQPVRESLSVILDELGTGLAARGADLNAVIRRADPALGYTNQVFKILSEQNRTLAKLATDSDTVLAPLANARSSLAGFVVNANTTATATAQRSSDISRSIQLLPTFLSRLRPLMADLDQLATQGTPLMKSLGQSAASLNSEFSNLGPFATAARTALINLGNAAQSSQQDLIDTEPLAQRLQNLGNAAAPSAASLDTLTASLDSSGGIQQLMSLLFYGTGATNGYDANGHYVRTDALVGSCTAYARAAVPICNANFFGPGSAAAASGITTGAGSGNVSTAETTTATAAATGQQSSTAPATPASGTTIATDLATGTGAAASTNLVDQIAEQAVTQQSRSAGSSSVLLRSLVHYLIGSGR